MIDFTILFRTAAFTGLLAVAGGSAAMAGSTTVTYNSFFPGTPLTTTQQLTDWNNGSQRMSVQSFDSTLGTLNSVTVTLLGDVTSFGNLENTSTTSDASIGAYSASTAIRLLPIGYSGALTNFTTAPIALATALPELINVSLKTLDTGGTITFSVTDSQATGGFTTSTDLGVYETAGLGSILFPLFTTTKTSTDVSGGNLKLNQTTSGYAEVTIAYNYTAAVVPPVIVDAPEPASLALLGAGLAALGITRRRRPV